MITIKGTGYVGQLCSQQNAAMFHDLLTRIGNASPVEHLI